MIVNGRGIMQAFQNLYWSKYEKCGADSFSATQSWHFYVGSPFQPP